MMRWKVLFEFFCNRVTKKTFFCLLLSLMAYPSFTWSTVFGVPAGVGDRC